MVAGAMAATAGNAVVQISARELADVMRKFGRMAPPSAPKPKQRKQHKRPGGGARKAETTFSNGPARSFKKSEKNAVVVTGSYIDTINNTGTGACGANWMLSLDTTPNYGWSNLSAVAKLNSFKAMYRHWRLLELVVTFVPAVADTVGGSLAIAFDADPAVNAATSLNAVYIKEIASLGHIRSEQSIRWKPFSAKDREEKFTTTQTARPIEELSFGQVLLSSSNSLATGNNLGYLKFDYKVAFDEEVL